MCIVDSKRSYPNSGSFSFVTLDKMGVKGIQFEMFLCNKVTEKVIGIFSFIFFIFFMSE